MPPAQQLTEMHTWPSYLYWRENDDRLKQHWYISFCLMMSSVQDRLTGLELYNNGISGNMNWAISAHYYSVVHAGRLLCFLCSGSYPTGHSQLGAIMHPTGRKQTFNWQLPVYASEINAPEEQLLQEMKGSHLTLQSALEYEGMNGLTELLGRFWPILPKFKTLRNDSNYEALLIAHEKQHPHVTDGFHDLVDAAERASLVAVDIAIELYKFSVQHSPCYESMRDMLLRACNRYSSVRLWQTLGGKFNHSGSALRELARVKESLDGLINFDEYENACENMDRLDDFLLPIMYGEFREKSQLMMRWQNRVREFREILLPAN
jgi:hypothetical protein